MPHISLMKSLSKDRIFMHALLNPVSARGRVGLLGGIPTRRLTARTSVREAHSLEKGPRDPEIPSLNHLRHDSSLGDLRAAGCSSLGLRKFFCMGYSFASFMMFFSFLARVRLPRRSLYSRDRFPIPALGFRSKPDRPDLEGSTRLLADDDVLAGSIVHADPRALHPAGCKSGSDMVLFMGSAKWLRPDLLTKLGQCLATWPACQSLDWRATV